MNDADVTLTIVELACFSSTTLTIFIRKRHHMIMMMVANDHFCVDTLFYALMRLWPSHFRKKLSKMNQVNSKFGKRKESERGEQKRSKCFSVNC